MQFSIWPGVSHGVDYRGQIALFFSAFFSFSFGLLLFARRHEQVPLRCDLHCTTTAAAAARLPAVCLLLRNEWKNVCVYVWAGFSECALVSLHISRHKRWKSFLPLSGKSQPLWSRYKKKARERYWCWWIRLLLSRRAEFNHCMAISLSSGPERKKSSHREENQPCISILAHTCVHTAFWKSIEMDGKESLISSFLSHLVIGRLTRLTTFD